MEKSPTSIDAVKEIQAALKESELLLNAAIKAMESRGEKVLTISNEASARNGVKLIARFAWSVHEEAVTPYLSMISKEEISKDTTQKYEVEALNRVESALAKIPARQSKLLRMRFIENLSVREIAAKENKSIDSIDSAVRRGMRAVRLHLGDVPSSYKKKSERLIPFFEQLKEAESELKRSQNLQDQFDLASEAACQMAEEHSQTASRAIAEDLQLMAAGVNPDELREEIEAALGSLPKQLAEFLRMKYPQNLTFEEISDKTGKSRAAVDAIVRRGIHALKETKKGLPSDRTRQVVDYFEQTYKKRN